jgi:hypothetical protein
VSEEDDEFEDVDALRTQLIEEYGRIKQGWSNRRTTETMEANVRALRRIRDKATSIDEAVLAENADRLATVIERTKWDDFNRFMGSGGTQFDPQPRRGRGF